MAHHDVPPDLLPVNTSIDDPLFDALRARGTRLLYRLRIAQKQGRYKDAKTLAAQGPEGLANLTRLSSDSRLLILEILEELGLVKDGDRWRKALLSLHPRRRRSEVTKAASEGGASRRTPGADQVEFVALPEHFDVLRKALTLYADVSAGRLSAVGDVLPMGDSGRGPVKEIVTMWEAGWGALCLKRPRRPPSSKETRESELAMELLSAFQPEAKPIASALVPVHKKRRGTRSAPSVSEVSPLETVPRDLPSPASEKTERSAPKRRAKRRGADAA